MTLVLSYVHLLSSAFVANSKRCEFIPYKRTISNLMSTNCYKRVFSCRSEMTKDGLVGRKVSVEEDFRKHVYQQHK